jgi:hypothetical protein
MCSAARKSRTILRRRASHADGNRVENIRMILLSMKTYDFGRARHVPRAHAAPSPAPAAAEDGWKAYEAWLADLRERLDDERPPPHPERER